MKKTIIYIDLDNTMANYSKRAAELGVDCEDAKHVPGFFAELEPIENAINGFNLLSKLFDVYILTSSPWNNPYAAAEKIMWVKRYLGEAAYKRVIISHNKHLCAGDYLIDDCPDNGAAEFTGEWIQFGSNEFENWFTVCNHICAKEKISVTDAINAGYGNLERRY